MLASQCPPFGGVLLPTVGLKTLLDVLDRPLLVLVLARAVSVLTEFSGEQVARALHVLLASADLTQHGRSLPKPSEAGHSPVKWIWHRATLMAHHRPFR